MSGLSRFATSSLDQPLGKDRWLQAGVDYAAVIEDLDAEQAEETGRINLVFRAKEGTHRDSMFVQNKDGTGYGWAMRMLLAAALPDLKAQQEFKALLDRSATAVRVLESLRGMHVLLRLEQTPGFRVLPNVDNQTYRAINAFGVCVAEAPTFTEVERRAKAAGLKKSFRRVKTMGVIDEDTKENNLQAFRSVVASIKRAQEAAGDSAASDTTSYTVPDAEW